MVGISRAVGAIIDAETSTETIAIYGGILLNIGLVLLFVFAFWGLVQRKRYGRWLSVGIVLIILATSILGQFFRPEGPVEYYEYENANQRMGGIFASILIVGLFGFLLYRLVFGESVSDFFSGGGPGSDELSDLPPPPESYMESTFDEARGRE